MSDQKEVSEAARAASLAIRDAAADADLSTTQVFLENERIIQQAIDASVAQANDQILALRHTLDWRTAERDKARDAGYVAGLREAARLMRDGRGAVTLFEKKAKELEDSLKSEPK